MELKKTLVMPKGHFPMRANLPQKEPVFVERWQEIDLYGLLLDEHKDDKPFYLHDGPPYANNEIHAGHALNKIVKDIIIRSKNLEGYLVPYTPGWDCHGLPIELCVTRSGVDRRTTPPAEFRKKCHDYALSQVAIQKKQMLSLGVIGDYNHPYLTIDPVYESHQLEVFRDMALKGLIYKGLKPVNWSPSSESALAEAEIEYKDVSTTTVFVRMDVTQGNGIVNPGDSFVIWTTTPWTLPANLAVCLNPKFEYGLYDTDKGRLVFLKDLVPSLIEQLHLEKCEIISSFKGEDVEGCKVKHPFYDRESLVVIDDYVTSDSGTGQVHIAPGHGLDDYKVGKKYDLPPLCPVDTRGYMTEEAGPELQGLFYEDCSKKVIEIITDNGTLLASAPLTHSYPHDWRTKKPTIFRATQQWFCSISPIKDKLLEEADKVSFIPEWGKVRLENMLANREDWCISRQRLWGVPIPIFYGEDGEPLLEKELFDHVIELVREHGSSIWYEWDTKDLMPEGYTSSHSPNGTFTKEKDIMDVWFDSGSSFSGSDIALGHPFPADVVLEGNDQYRGWYNSSMILSVATTGQSPYKQVITHGFLVDQNGEKFSKSKKNGIDPLTICKTFGADILRLWTTTVDYSVAEIKLSQDLLKSVSDEYRKIRNTFKFMITNLEDDDEGHVFDPSYEPANLSLVDKMILEKLNKILIDMRKNYDEYNFMKVTDAVTNFFVNDLSSFYLDFSKDTLYCETAGSEKRRNVQYVLYKIVHDLAIAYSPILAFTCEEIYDSIPVIDRKQSVAMESYPETHECDEELLSQYRTLLSVRESVNALIEPVRKEGTVGSSSECQIYYCPASDEERALIEELGEEQLCLIFIVSGFSLSDHSQCVKHSGTRCDRCWNYFNDIEETQDGEHVCHRCHEAVRDYKEPEE